MKAKWTNNLPDANEEPGKNETTICTEGSSLIVKSNAVAMTTVEVYSFSGQLVARQTELNAPEIKIEDLPKGILIVQISLQNGKIETKKIYAR
ncbi:MAG: T9SS type A sorting domain-containing protein [Tannerella sp.]|nr:T9SS type A sorting domain-containing protein [Tannerella sp.]